MIFDWKQWFSIEKAMIFYWKAMIFDWKQWFSCVNYSRYYDRMVKEKAYQVDKNDELCIKSDGFVLEMMNFVFKIINVVWKLMGFV